MLSEDQLDQYLDSITNEENVEHELMERCRWKVQHREQAIRRLNTDELYAEAMSLPKENLDWAGLNVSKQARKTLHELGVTPRQLQRFFAHPEVLAEEPNLIDYYRKLANVSNNRMKDLEVYREASDQLHRTGGGQQQVFRPAKEVESLCKFLNKLISVWAEHAENSPEREANRAIQMRDGAAVEGRSRNAGGRRTVVQIGKFVTRVLDNEGNLDTATIKDETGDQKVFTADDPELSDTLQDDRLNDFTSITAENGSKVALGQSEPDMVIESSNGVTAVAEIKDRTDTSNEQEGWIPQVRRKLEDYSDQYPDADLLLAQPIYTESIIEGKEGNRGTIGVKQMMADGILNLPLNTTIFRHDDQFKRLYGECIKHWLGYDTQNPPVPGTSQRLSL